MQFINPFQKIRYLTPVVFILYHLLSFLINPYVSLLVFYSGDSATSILKSALVILFYSFFITTATLKTSEFLNHRLRWEEYPVKRVGIQFISSFSIAALTLTVIFLSALQSGSYQISDLFKEKTLSVRMIHWQFAFTMFFLSIIVSGIHTSSYFFTNWRTYMNETLHLRLKSAELKEIALQAELQSLKLQLDPHFMFNNFSILTDLISEDTELAKAFLKNLTKVYRYMIHNISMDVITLDEELKFIESYLFLLKIRYEENIEIAIDIPCNLRRMGIPPITLQLLIENAIKHNVASKQMPLRIQIKAEGPQRIRVENPIQKLHSPVYSAKLGLKNIVSRYRLLSAELPEITTREGNFCVSLPLLTLEK